MRGVLAEVPAELLEQRRRRGIDRYDEMWEGVLYLAAAPRRRHQRVAAALIAALHDPATYAGCQVEDGINVCDPDRPFDDHRIPDLVVMEPDAPAVGDDFGATGGIALAVDVRSLREDAVAKLAFYAARRVEQVLLVDVSDPSASSVRLLQWEAGTYVDVPAASDGAVAVLGVRVSPRPGHGPAGIVIEHLDGRRFL